MFRKQVNPSFGIYHKLSKGLIRFLRILLLVQGKHGLYQPGSYGPQALTWSELDCWVRLNGIKLSGWEARTVVDVSKAFVEQYETSNEHDVPSPWIPEDIDRDKIAADIGQIMRRLKNRRNKHG